MIHIRRATPEDTNTIAYIGRITVEEAHRDSCSAEDMQTFLDANYTTDAIRKELEDNNNIYHLVFWNEQPAGFSKIILDAHHDNLPNEHTTKLDRIYLLKQYYDLKLGHQLLQHNVALSRLAGQTGMWLFTWQGNERAVNFYKKAGFIIIGTHNFKISATHYNPNFHMLLDWQMHSQNLWAGR